MTRNTCVSAFICGSHIAIVVPSEFDSIRVGPPSRPSTDTLSRHPSASIIGMEFSPVFLFRRLIHLQGKQAGGRSWFGTCPDRPSDRTILSADRRQAAR